jgi:hypothetical protein
MKSKTAIAGVALALTGMVTAQDISTMPFLPLLETPSTTVWFAGPRSLPPGAKMVVLDGDPDKEGSFTLRLLLPDEYTIPPHSRPSIERITIISGSLLMGGGSKLDKSICHPMPVGTFGRFPPGMKRYYWTQGETVVQLHGIGPWKIDYVNQGDDPRKKK